MSRTADSITPADAFAVITAVRGSHANLERSSQAVYDVAAIMSDLDEHATLALMLAVARVAAGAFDQLQKESKTGLDYLQHIAPQFVEQGDQPAP